MVNNLSEKMAAFLGDHGKMTLLANSRHISNHSTMVWCVSNGYLIIWSHPRINLKARGIFMLISSSNRIHQKASVMPYWLSLRLWKGSDPELRCQTPHS